MGPPPWLLDFPLCSVSLCRWEWTSVSLGGTQQLLYIAFEEQAPAAPLYVLGRMGARQT
jgi:hypothetical protein